MKPSLRGTLIFFAALAAALSLRAGGQPLEEEKLVNVASPHVVGKWKFRFDFQHSFSDGSTYSDRMPVADLFFAFGVAPDVQVEMQDLFNNNRVTSGGQRAESRFSGFQQAVRWRVWNEETGRPLTASVALYHQHASYRAAFNGVTTSQTSYDVWSEEVIVQRSFGRLQPTLAWRRMSSDYVGAPGTKELSALQAGLRAALLRRRKAALDAVADATLAQSTDGLGYRKAWGAGLQFSAYSPHTITLFVSNTSGQTLPDAVWGYRDTFKSFRWSYRF